MSNDHLYECNFLNSLEKKVDYSRIFVTLWDEDLCEYLRRKQDTVWTHPGSEL